MSPPDFFHFIKQASCGGEEKSDTCVLIRQRGNFSVQCKHPRYVVWKKFCVLSAHRIFFYVQGSYWAIDTNPKEDALPTRPKKRPRSGERVSIRGTLHIPEKTHFSTCAFPLIKLLPPFLLHLCLLVSTSASVFFSFYPPFSPTLSVPHTHTHTRTDTDSVGVHIQT